MAMDATLGITVTTAANFIPEIWSKEVKRATISKLVMKNLVKRFDLEANAKKGDTFHIPDVSNLVANDKAKCVAVTLQPVTEDKTDISIDKHKETSFLVEDIVKVQSAYDLQKEYTTMAGKAIAKAIDTDLLGLYSGLSQIVGTYGVAIDDAKLLRAVQYLDDADADEEDRSCVIKPSVKADLFKIDKFVRADWSPYIKEKSSPIHTGKIAGDIYGVRFYVTTNVNSTAGTPTQINNILFQKEALACAVQKDARTQGDYVLEYLGTLVVCDIIYGVKEYRDNHGVWLKA